MTDNDAVAVARAEVTEAYLRYVDAFTRMDPAALDAVIAYPLAYIAADRTYVLDAMPEDPAVFGSASDWHSTANVRYEVVAVSPDKAHVVLHHADRLRADGSLIYTMSMFYALRRTETGWRVYAMSDVIVPPPPTAG